MTRNQTIVNGPNQRPIAPVPNFWTMYSNVITASVIGTT